MKRITDILKKFYQYESIPYANDYTCPECGKSGIGSHAEKKCALIGWCETPSGYMVVCECPVCGKTFRFHPHLDRFDFDAFNDRIEFDYLGDVSMSHVSNSEELDRELTELNQSEK